MTLMNEASIYWMNIKGIANEGIDKINILMITVRIKTIGERLTNFLR